jgi:hypothetical protein
LEEELQEVREQMNQSLEVKGSLDKAKKSMQQQLDDLLEQVDENQVRR